MFALPGICFYFGETYNTLKVANNKNHPVFKQVVEFTKLIFFSSSLLLPELKVKRSGQF